MSGYWFGLATLPALAIFYLVVAAIGGRVMASIVSAADFTIHRIKPDVPMVQRRLRAAAVYGAPRGLVIARGRFGLVLISGLDTDAQSWAYDQLATPLRHISKVRRTFPGEEAVDE